MTTHYKTAAEAIERFGDHLTCALASAAHLRRPLSDVAAELASRPGVEGDTQLIYEIINQAAMGAAILTGSETIKF